MNNSFSYNTGYGGSANITTILFYVFVVILISLVTLVIIHYTYKPIFGKKSSLLSGNSGTVYWEKEDSVTHTPIPESSTSLGSRYCNYSICFDMIVDDALSGTGSTSDRAVLRRGKAGSIDCDTTDNNFIIVLDKSVNDLYVKIKCEEPDGNKPIVALTVDNLPTQRDFTLGLVLSESFMEVYLNGALYQTKSFGTAKLIATAGDFKTGLGPDTTYSRIKRLRIWDDIIDADTMRAYAGSVEPRFTQYNGARMSGTCSTS